ncbi:MAG: BrnT family toxin [Alphaproteobacteria bacterium]|nr:BrnT family toxin [Alphaproteobacteria bacterium]
MSSRFRDLVLEVHGEERWIAVGLIEDVHVTVVFTRRAAAIRLISMRRSRHEERRKYQNVFGG